MSHLGDSTKNIEPIVPHSDIKRPIPMKYIQFLEINTKYMVASMPKRPSKAARREKKVVKCFLSMLSW